MDDTNTMLFIENDQVPRDKIKDVAYSHIVVGYLPQKVNPHITRLTVRGRGDLLLRRCQHTCGRHNNGKYFHQRYHFNGRGKVHVM